MGLVKDIISLPRLWLGFALIMLSYCIAGLSKWTSWLGAYLMDHEKFWKLHDVECKDKLGKIDCEELLRKSKGGK